MKWLLRFLLMFLVPIIILVVAVLIYLSFYFPKEELVKYVLKEYVEKPYGVSVSYTNINVFLKFPFKNVGLSLEAFNIVDKNTGEQLGQGDKFVIFVDIWRFLTRREIAVSGVWIDNTFVELKKLLLTFSKETVEKAKETPKKYIPFTLQFLSFNNVKFSYGNEVSVAINGTVRNVSTNISQIQPDVKLDIEVITNFGYIKLLGTVSGTSKNLRLNIDLFKLTNNANLQLVLENLKANLAYEYPKNIEVKNLKSHLKLDYIGDTNYSILDTPIYLEAFADITTNQGYVYIKNAVVENLKTKLKLKMPIYSISNVLLSIKSDNLELKSLNNLLFFVSKGSMKNLFNSGKAVINMELEGDIKNGVITKAIGMVSINSLSLLDIKVGDFSLSANYPSLELKLSDVSWAGMINNVNLNSSLFVNDLKNLKLISTNRIEIKSIVINSNTLANLKREDKGEGSSKTKERGTEGFDIEKLRDLIKNMLTETYIKIDKVVLLKDLEINNIQAVLSNSGRGIDISLDSSVGSEGKIFGSISTRDYNYVTYNLSVSNIDIHDISKRAGIEGNIYGVGEISAEGEIYNIWKLLKGDLKSISGTINSFFTSGEIRDLPIQKKVVKATGLDFLGDIFFDAFQTVIYVYVDKIMLKNCYIDSDDISLKVEGTISKDLKEVEKIVITEIQISKNFVQSLPNPIFLKLSTMGRFDEQGDFLMKPITISGPITNLKVEMR